MRRGRMRELLLGNEAIARGAWEAGVKFAAGYPGTPSTEIIETLAARYPETNPRWSANEQDNRYFGRMGKVPILEPSDAQECRDFILYAFDLSEQFGTPVMLRTTT